jgi:hypothetical protein
MLVDEKKVILSRSIGYVTNIMIKTIEYVINKVGRFVK